MVFWVYPRQQLKYRTAFVKLSTCGHGRGTQSRLSPEQLYRNVQPPPPNITTTTSTYLSSVSCFPRDGLLNMQAVISPYIPPDKSSPKRTKPLRLVEKSLTFILTPSCLCGILRCSCSYQFTLERLDVSHLNCQRLSRNQEMQSHKTGRAIDASLMCD